MKNKQTFFVISLFFFFNFLNLFAIQESTDNPIINVKVDQVKVNIIVEDKKGDIIQGLTEENFRVYEDKVLQEINYFTSPDENPVSVVLITEFSKVIPFQFLHEAWYGSNVFISKMKEDDWIAIIAYDIRPEILVDFTQDKDKAYNALRRLNSPAFRESSLYDTLYDTLNRLEAVEEATSIVLISSGLDTFSKKNLDNVLKKVRESNSTIYSLSLGGNLRTRYGQNMSNDTRMDLYQADALLKSLAKYTGGEAFFPRYIQDFEAIFENISLLSHNQYSIGYVSNSNNKENKLRKIKVEVIADIDNDGKPDKFKAIHKEGYYPN